MSFGNVLYQHAPYNPSQDTIVFYSLLVGYFGIVMTILLTINGNYTRDFDVNCKNSPCLFRAWGMKILFLADD